MQSLSPISISFLNKEILAFPLAVVGGVYNGLFLGSEAAAEALEFTSFRF